MKSPKGARFYLTWEASKSEKSVRSVRSVWKSRRRIIMNEIKKSKMREIAGKYVI